MGVGMCAGKFRIKMFLHALDSLKIRAICSTKILRFRTRTSSHRKIVCLSLPSSIPQLLTLFDFFPPNLRRAWEKIEKDGETLLAAARVTRTEYLAPFRACLYHKASTVTMSGGAVAGASRGDEVVRDNWDSSDDDDDIAGGEEEEKVRENWDSSDEDVGDADNNNNGDDQGVGRGGEGMKHPAVGAGEGELMPVTSDITGTVDEGVRAEDGDPHAGPLAAAGSSSSSIGQVAGEGAGGASGGSDHSRSTQDKTSRDVEVGEDATASSSSGAAVRTVKGQELPSSRASKATTVDAAGGGCGVDSEAPGGSSSMRWRAGGGSGDDKR